MARINPKTWDAISLLIQQEAHGWRFLDGVDRPTIVGFVVSVLDRVKTIPSIAEIVAEDLYEGEEHGA